MCSSLKETWEGKFNYFKLITLYSNIKLTQNILKYTLKNLFLVVSFPSKGTKSNICKQY